MNASYLKRNIANFCLYRFVSRFYLYLPILAIILYNYKLSYLEISYVLAAHGLTIMVFKTPLNTLSRKIPLSKFIIFIGELVKSVGVLSLAISNGNIYILIIAQIISGIGFSLTSGTESGLLLKAMKAENAQDKYRMIEAKSQGYGFISILISGVIGSVIAKTNIAMALYLTAPFSILAAVIIIFFKEPLNADFHSSSNQTMAKDIIKSSIRSVLNLLLYYAINRAIIMSIFVFLLPIFLLKSFHIDLAFFGAILGLFSLTAYLIGINFEKVSSLFKNSQLWLIVPGSILCVILLLILQNQYLLLAIPILLGIAASIVRPLAIGKVNSMVKENNSVIMSRGEQFFGLFNSFFLILIGFLFNNFTLSAVLYILISVLLIFNILLAVLFIIPQKSQTAEI